jgi:PAS domain S-box-containing protein
MPPTEESDVPKTRADDNLLVDGIEDLAFFQTLVEEAGEAILTLDTSGVIVSANPAAGQLFGYEVDDLLGEYVGLLFPFPRDDEWFLFRSQVYLGSPNSTQRG